MKIFVNKPLKNSKNLPEIIKSIKNTENNHKNSYFDLGRNPMEIVHGPLKIKYIKNHKELRFKHFFFFKEKLFSNKKIFKWSKDSPLLFFSDFFCQNSFRFVNNFHRNLLTLMTCQIKFFMQVRFTFFALIYRIARNVSFKI